MTLKDLSGASGVPSWVRQLIVLLVILLALFWKSLLPNNIVFSNDGPLGAVAAECRSVPEIYTGEWDDLNSIGGRGGGALPNISYMLLWILGPVGFAKFYAPLALLILGLGAWFCFRQLKLAPAACTLGSIAAMLNSVFFTTVAWGVAAQAIMGGLMFTALGLVMREAPPRLRWLNFILAGFAVGMGVMEGFDVGALLSMAVAAFVIYITMVEEGPLVLRAGKGVLRLVTVAVFAGFIAMHALTSLIGTQVKGVAGTQQDQQTKQERWDWATTWSFRKQETLTILIPGLFGYRMDTPRNMVMFADAYDGGFYWGAAGRDPAWDRYLASGKQGPEPGGFIRYTGGSVYVGTLVALVAFWSLLQSVRRTNSVFTLSERQFLWFWGVALIIALPLAYGRFAPFYQFVYQLPYFSTIRNPSKLLYVFNLGVIFLFAYGVDGLCRRYLKGAPARSSSDSGSWWAKANAFDRWWVFGSFAAVFAAFVGWIAYASARKSLEEYIRFVEFDPATARMLAGFSIGQVGWFVLTLAVSVIAVTLVIRGNFAGRRALAGVLLLGGILVLDMGRANLPWVVYWDYKEKYATNFMIEDLRKNAHERRVAALPFEWPPGFSGFNNLYRFEWLQHHFQLYNIQSLDIIQMPRKPEDLAAYDTGLALAGLTRRWELSNTRYLLGPAVFPTGPNSAVPAVELLNQQLDPTLRRFRVLTQFGLALKPGVLRPQGLEHYTVEPKSDGLYALFDFTGALPRAKLYSNWKVSTNEPAELKAWVDELMTVLPSNWPAEWKQAFLAQSPTDQATLRELSDSSFNPHETVLLAEPLPGVETAGNSTNQIAGTVEYESYSPKKIILKANSAAPSVLLLNDKYDPNWKVLVDGQPAPLLRCNFIMRGVYLAPGAHTVEFSFEPPIRSLYISLLAIGIAVLTVACVVVTSRRRRPQDAKPESR